MDYYDFKIELLEMKNNDFDLIFLNTNEIMNIAIDFLYVFE